MKVLFINPYIYDFTAYDLWLRPLSLLYLASVVEKYSDSELFWLDTLDRFSNKKIPVSKKDGRGKYYREIVKKPEIYEQVPRNYSRYGIPLYLFEKKLDELPELDIIFITSIMTYWIDGLNFTLKKLRKRFPNSLIVLGGILPTLLKEKIRDFVEADLYVEGYGEKKILEIIKNHGGKVSKYPDFSELDNIPFPKFSFLGTKKYLPVITSRGCPYRCTYCASHLLNDRFRERSYQNIYNEISLMNKKYGTEHFVIFDDAFLINKKNRFKKAFEMVKKDLNVSFHTPNGIHTREIDNETAHLLFNSGFRTIRLSFESTDINILKKSSGKVNTREMAKAVNNLEKAGYKRGDIECYLLFGIPGQSISELERSINYVREIGIVPRLSLFSPVPGTIEFNELKHKGIISGKPNLYETNKIFFLYLRSGFSESEIMHIQDLVRNSIPDN
ncbi:MAG: radical SAM protein [Acidobacteriota bacterium]